jgi:hypothetical protein
MKLAEALNDKKALLTRIGELQGRYTASAVVDEGEVSTETPAELFTGLETAFGDLEYLTVAINMTNNTIVLAPEATGISNPVTMMQAIVHRDNLKLRIANLRAIIEAIRDRNSRGRYYGEGGTKKVVAEGVSLAEFIKVGDDLSKKLRLLDASIQAANWTNDLVS